MKKLKFVDPVQRNNREQFVKKVKENLDKLKIPYVLELCVTNKDQKGLASEILLLADQLKQAANFFGLDPKDFVSVYDFVQSDREDNCHDFDLVENITNLTLTKHTQALIEDSDAEQKPQVAILSIFKKGALVSLGNDVCLKAIFDGVVAQRLDFSTVDQTGHSVTLTQELELIPIERVTFLD